MSFDGFISYSHAADGRLAPAVQRGLHRLAKPWHRRRALWIFRDQTGLSVTPGLWSSIQKALDGSEWFVLLASPEAARSPWVNREIEYWISAKPANRILPVVTDGEWRWDPAAGDLSADSTAVPDALRGVFAEEPLFLDLRWARDGEQLNLRDSRFRDAIAELAAPMHGVSKDELDSEDVRQHRRVGRLRQIAIATVAVLTMVASGTGVLAGHNADRAAEAAVEAQRQQEDALQQRGNAKRSAEEAQRQEANARAQEENARTQEARARAATTERKQQEKLAREQQDAAKRAGTEAERQQKNARRQQELAKQSQKLAEQQQQLAEEQRALVRESKRETVRQQKIAEEQQRLAEAAGAEAERQKRTAAHQQQMAEEAADDAHRQKLIAAENERKAKAAAEEARRQESITLGRRLFNRAQTMIGSEPNTALGLGLAAQQVQPGAEAGSELTGLLAMTRRVGTRDGFLYVAYGPKDIIAAVESDYRASLWNVADRANPVRVASLDGKSYIGDPVFSPDRKTLVLSGGSPYGIHVFDVSDPAHPAPIGSLPGQLGGWVTFSPDGQTLATSDFYGVWTLWDMADRTRPAKLTTQTDAALGPVAFSQDGRTMATAGKPGIIWDISDRTRPIAVSTLDGDWQRVSFGPYPNTLYTTDVGGTLTHWHIGDRKKPRVFHTEAMRVSEVTFSSDGRLLATSDREGTARVWDMTGATPRHMFDVDDRTGSARSVAFSPDNQILATTGGTGTLGLWSIGAPGEPAVSGRVVGRGDKVMTAGLTPDGRSLITVQEGGTATVWDLSQPTGPVERATIRVHPTYLRRAAISPTGDMIATVGLELTDRVMLTDISDPQAPAPLSSVPAGGIFFADLVFSPDGRKLATGGGLIDVVVWDLTDRRQPAQMAYLDAETSVGTVTFSPDGRTIALAEKEEVALWGLADRPARIGTLKGHFGPVLAMAFSPDGRTLATGSADKTAALWNVAGPLRRRAILTGDRAEVWSVAFAPDGRTLATGTENDQAVLWDLPESSTPVRVAALQRRDLTTKVLLFHPDGRTLITSGTKYVNVWGLVWDYAALNDLRADPAAVACAVTGGGFTAEDWAAHVPEAPYQQACTR